MVVNTTPATGAVEQPRRQLLTIWRGLQRRCTGCRAQRWNWPEELIIEVVAIGEAPPGWELAIAG